MYIALKHRNQIWGCKPERLGEGSKIGKSPKVVRRRRNRSFGATAQSLLRHMQPCFAPVQPHVAPVQEAFRSLGSKDLLHPLLSTFGDFPIFDPGLGVLLPRPFAAKNPFGKLP